MKNNITFKQRHPSIFLRKRIPPFLMSARLFSSKSPDRILRFSEYLFEDYYEPNSDLSHQEFKAELHRQFRELRKQAAQGLQDVQEVEGVN